MRDLIEGIGYYLSCMILFNGIYGLKIVAKGTVFANSCTKENMAGITTLALAALLVVIGVFFTAQILTTDDSETNSIATGKQFKVTTVKDLTGENYFANFSLIVLTGLSLSDTPGLGDLMIFLLIEAALGIIYIKKKMFYMNPVLSLLDYSIYECTGINAITKKEYLGTFYFLIKGKSISNKSVIKYKNINSHVIRLNQYSEGNSH